MHSIARNERSFYTSISEGIEYSKSSLVKNVKIITNPMSDSLPIYYILNIFKKVLQGVNYFQAEPLAPNVIKSLDGLSSFVGLGNFVNLTIGLIPCLTKTNLDEDALKQSIMSMQVKHVDDPELNDPQKDEEVKKIWAKRIIKWTKLSLEQEHTLRAVKEKLAQKMIEKQQKVNRELTDDELKPHVYDVIDQLTIKTKKISAIQRIYLYCFTFVGVNGVLKTLTKWQLIDLGKISARIGRSEFAIGITKVLKPEVTKFITSYSLNDLAKCAGLIGGTIKLSYDGYKLYSTCLNVNQAAPGSEEYKNAVKERTAKIWAVSLGTLSLIGSVAPLLLTINPVVLLTYEVGVLTLGLYKVLKY